MPSAVAAITATSQMLVSLPELSIAVSPLFAVSAAKWFVGCVIVLLMPIAVAFSAILIFAACVFVLPRELGRSIVWFGLRIIYRIRVHGADKRPAESRRPVGRQPRVLAGRCANVTAEQSTGENDGLRWKLSEPPYENRRRSLASHRDQPRTKVNLKITENGT